MNIEDEDKEDAIHFYKSGDAEKNDVRKEPHILRSKHGISIEPCNILTCD